MRRRRGGRPLCRRRPNPPASRAGRAAPARASPAARAHDYSRSAICDCLSLNVFGLKRAPFPCASECAAPVRLDRGSARCTPRRGRTAVGSGGPAAPPPAAPTPGSAREQREQRLSAACGRAARCSLLLRTLPDAHAMLARLLHAARRAAPPKAVQAVAPRGARRRRRGGGLQSRFTAGVGVKTGFFI